MVAWTWFQLGPASLPANGLQVEGLDSFIDANRSAMRSIRFVVPSFNLPPAKNGFMQADQAFVVVCSAATAKQAPGRLKSAGRQRGFAITHPSIGK